MESICMIDRRDSPVLSTLRQFKNQIGISVSEKSISGYLYDLGQASFRLYILHIRFVYRQCVLTAIWPSHLNTKT
jgi:hypothetical protein